MMQDTIEKLAHKSINTYLNLILNKSPNLVQCISSNKVLNHFNQFEGIGEVDKNIPKPIFILEIDEDIQNQHYKYNYDLQFIVDEVLNNFKEGIKILSNIEPLDKRMMKDVMRSELKNKLDNTPELPLEEPITYTYEELREGKLNNRNKWIYDSYKSLENFIKSSIIYPKI